ncbi:MAG: GHKL domain-containing protein [Clostridia bacterium]|jgi:signal transduction histidine kinase|nr:GHKL domain-containing protein [Clostridia bacterium]
MKIVTNSIFRWTLFLTTLAATIFFPLFFGLPRLNAENRLLLGILVAIVAVSEILVFVFVHYKMLVRPIRTIGDATKKLSSGEYSMRLNLKRVDKDVKSLAIGMNNIANEFESLELMRKSFVANASHELRSPLTSIQGFLQAILDGTIEPAEQDKYLKIVLTESKRLSLLINSMLDLSRLESGKNPPNLTKFEIREMIRQVAERFEPNLQKHGMRLALGLMPEECFVYADRDKIIQVLSNLIDNAIKYSPPNSQIAVTTNMHGKKVYVTVKDNGYGISKKDQMLIWDRFYMADKARTPAKAKGTGLGLSIVKKIIDEHKEVIWVESNAGAGATFIFTLTAFDPDKHSAE